MGIQFNGNTDTISTNDGTLNVNPQTTFGGEVGIAGTLTYEDVTNIDSVGVITARSGIRVGVNGIKRETVHLDAGDSGANYLRFTNTTTGNGTADGFNVGINADEHALLWNFETKDTIFATNNLERLRIASDGDVGIGTNAPVERVHIHKPSATGPFLYITNTSTGVSASDGIQIGYDGTNTAVLKNNENTDLVFDVNGSPRLNIKAAGDVNVLTGHLQAQDLKLGLASNRYPIIQRAVASSGSQHLAITGGSGYSDNTTSSHTPTDAKQGALIQLGAGNPTSDTFGGFINYYANGHTSPNVPGNGGQHVFYTRSGVDTYTERLRISSDGYVTKPNQPMFAAHGSGDAIAAATPLPFDSIVYNIGSHYNNSTHKFTCPATGYYYVTCHVVPTNYTSGGNNVELFIQNAAGTRYFLDRKVKSTNYAGNNFSVGGSRILYAAKNDTLDVKFNAISGSPTLEGSSHFGIMLMA